MAHKKTKKRISKENKMWVILAVIIIVFIGIKVTFFSDLTPHSDAPTNTSPAKPHDFDFGNQTIILNDQTLQLRNNEYQTTDETTGEHVALFTHRSANPSQTKAAAILLDNPGGTGAFYYLIGASLQNGKEVYSKPILIGDRVKIVSVAVAENGIITVDYLDRTSGAPMAAEPTQEKTLQYSFDSRGNLAELAR